MTDAEATVKFAILNAMVDNCPITNEKFIKVRDDIFKSIFSPHLSWAIEEYLKEIKQ
jgi:hypothetical protein